MGLNTIEIMNKGINCLLEKLGVAEAEQFISIIIRGKFDYTKWQQKHFDEMTPEQIDDEALCESDTHSVKLNI
ncbi:MAG: hypothetical protein ACLU9Q_15230 [Marvinbryantia sp.]|uniref:hypothetical protein n=1 Tax=Marvinbryantia sp. TaxID=2496532 RepID=UPI0039998EAF